MTDHLKDPQAVSWGDLAEDFAFTDAEKDQIHPHRALVVTSGGQGLAVRAERHRVHHARPAGQRGAGAAG